MRANSFNSYSGRLYTRRALVCSRLQNCVALTQHEQHGRRFAVLQCISVSTNTSDLAKLSAQSPPGVHDDVAALRMALTRRSLLVLAAAASATLCHQLGSTARAEEPPIADAPAASPPAASSGGTGAVTPPAALTEYTNGKQRYRLLVPAEWDVKGKAGADVLFEDPLRRSTNVGVTVNPVKVASLAMFGGLEDVGTKLLEAERRKESTLNVVLVSSSSRVGDSGATLYDYEYELDSTRGRKRILNTVTIFNSRLYILNAAFKCEKEACGEAAEQGVRLLRRVAASFDVTAG